jgi:hypothetical protein
MTTLLLSVNRPAPGAHKMHDSARAFHQIIAWVNKIWGNCIVSKPSSPEEEEMRRNCAKFDCCARCWSSIAREIAITADESPYDTYL